VSESSVPVERDFHANGLVIHAAVWERAGSRQPPLVMLHGIWDTWRTFEPVAPRMAAGRTTIALDLRGHGGSEKPAHGYDFADYAADVLGVIEQLAGAPVDLLGFSLGALVSIHVASHHPERVRRLVLEDPPFSPDADRRGRAMWFEHLLELKRQPFEQVVEGLAELYPTRDRGTNEVSARALIGTADGPFRAFLDGERADLEVPSLLQRLPRPLFILRADPAMGGACSDAGRDGILAVRPDARLVEFPETGHLIHGEQPDRFIESVEGFLSGAD
jgi:pimeloyl-ACP methyl ester carboxylesterase